MKTKLLIVCLSVFITVSCDNQSKIIESGKTVISKTSYSVISRTVSNQNAVLINSKFKKLMNTNFDYPPTEVVEEYDVTVFEFPDTTFKVVVDYTNNTATEFPTDTEIEDSDLRSQRAMDSLDIATNPVKIVYENDMITCFNSTGEVIVQEDISKAVPDSIKTGLKESDNSFLLTGKINGNVIEKYKSSKDLTISDMGNNFYETIRKNGNETIVLKFNNSTRTISESRHYINDDLISQATYGYMNVTTKYGTTKVLQKRDTQTNFKYPNGISCYLKREMYYNNYKKEYYQ